MDRETLGIYVQTHRSANECKGNKHQKQNRNAQHNRNLTQVVVEAINQGFLISHLTHLGQLLDYGCCLLEGIFAEIFAFDIDIDGERNRIDFEDPQEIFAEKFLHLPCAFLF